MKLKYSLLFFIYAFFVFGCEQKSTTLIPINSTSQESIDLFHQALDYESVDKEKEASEKKTKAAVKKTVPKKDNGNRLA